jgi:hypothetical protein
VNTNTTISHTRVTHAAEKYIVSTIHATAANYYETCLFGPRRHTKVLDEYATEHAAHLGHDRWVALRPRRYLRCLVGLPPPSCPSRR